MKHRAGKSALVLAALAVLMSCGSRTLRPPDVFGENTGMVRSALDNRAFVWQHRSTAHLDAHYLPERWSAADVDSILAQMEALYRGNAQTLGESAYDSRIDVFLVGPKSDVGVVCGQAVTACALLPERAAVYSNLKLATRPEILQHELMHVMSFDIWGLPQDFFMAEGLATSAYGVACYGLDFDAIAAYLLRRRELPSLRQMTGDIFRYEEAVTHYSAASFVRMVEGLYGREGARTLWTGGIEHGARRLGTNIGRLDEVWRTALAQTPGITDHDWQRLLTADVDSLQTDSVETRPGSR